MNWFRKATRQRLPRAQVKLALMCRFGYGLKRNLVQAYMWYELAAPNGGGAIKSARDNLASTMSADQIAQAKKIAAEWKAKHGRK